jgi:mevalonate kinase
MVKVSAPGKCIIIGEHAVVYGEPAILAAIGKRVSVDAEKSDEVAIIDSKLDIDEKFAVSEAADFVSKVESMWQNGFEKKDFSGLFDFLNEEKVNAVKAMIGKSLKELNINSGVELSISSEIPIGAGLGSSAALAVAVPKAVSEAYNMDVSRERVNEIAYSIEQFTHGRPSGGDNSACCFGGLIWFKRGEPDIIKPLGEEIPYTLENFVLVYTGKPEKTTGELVQMVRNLEPGFRDKRIKTLGKLAREMRSVLKGRNFERMKEIINSAQQNLSELGLSTEEIDRISETLKGVGGAAKLCGAGGGGIVLCYHQDRDKLVNTIKNLGFEPVEVELAVEGVRVED